MKSDAIDEIGERVRRESTYHGPRGKETLDRRSMEVAYEAVFFVLTYLDHYRCDLKTMDVAKANAELYNEMMRVREGFRNPMGIAYEGIWRCNGAGPISKPPPPETLASPGVPPEVP